MRRITLPVALAAWLATASPWPLAAAEPVVPAPSLAELAAQADLVALVRVADTDYRRQRGLPVSGSAWLQVLIRYAGEAPEDRIEVYEQGLRPGECYFEDPVPGEEGGRFLVLLRRDAEAPGRFRGLDAGCAIDVLVKDDGRYAVRAPVLGIAVRDDLAPLVIPMTFADRHALVSDDDLAPAERNAMLAQGFIDPVDGGRRWRFTHGIELAAFRSLLESGTTP